MVVPVIYGSVRSDRQGIRAARFAMQQLRARACTPVLVDPMEKQLPLLDRMYKEYAPGQAPPTLEELAQLYRSADGFIFVSGEYNHGIPPALKNLIDHFLEEYFWRPAGIVCYSGGRYGGVRAAMQLRMTLAECGMVTIPSLLPIPTVSTAFTEDGVANQQWMLGAATRFFDEFEWYMRALRPARAAGTPY